MINLLVRTNGPNTSCVVASCTRHPGDHYNICSMDEQDRKADPELSVGQTVGSSDHPYYGIGATGR